MKRVFLLFLVIPLTCLAANSQNEQLKSFYIFNIIRYVNWPEEARSGNFIICIVQNNEVAQFIKGQASGRRFGYQDFEVNEYSRIEDINRCHVLFLGSGINVSRINSAVIDNVISSGALVVTEANGVTPYGSSINFVEKGDELFFEIHSNNAERAGLQFSSRLIAMSTAIKF